MCSIHIHFMLFLAIIIVFYIIGSANGDKKCKCGLKPKKKILPNARIRGANRD